MSAESEAVSLEEPKAWKSILWGGLTAGALDISAAFIDNGFRGRSPAWVLQSVASGLLGASSYTGGFKTAALGGVLHFFIAFVATAIYYAASRRLNFLVRRAVTSGALYGVAVYLFMYFLVLPVTFSRKPSYPMVAVITGLIIHMLCVGLPIALVVRRCSK